MASILTGILKDASNGQEESKWERKRKKKMSCVGIDSLNPKLRQSAWSYYLMPPKFLNTFTYIVHQFWGNSVNADISLAG